MRVVLTTEELIEFGSQGLARCANALAKKRQGAHGIPPKAARWQIDVEGLLCEAAAAKGLGLPYTPTVGALDTDLGDIGPRLQVRGTEYSTGSLIMHNKDADDHKFILVTGSYGQYDLRGWIYGREGKHPKFWGVRQNRGSYWVAQNWLKPIETVLDAP